MIPLLIEFCILWLCAASMIGAIIASVCWHDRIVVALMRHFNLHFFPTAIAIAMLIFEHPEQWKSDQYHMSHPDIGSIWIANETYGLKVITAYGNWKPNFLERRIIRNAVDWRLREYVKGRLTLALQRNALTNRRQSHAA